MTTFVTHRRGRRRGAVCALVASLVGGCHRNGVPPQVENLSSLRKAPASESAAGTVARVVHDPAPRRPLVAERTRGGREAVRRAAGAAMESMFGRDTAIGSDPENVVGGLAGPSIGETSGTSAGRAAGAPRRGGDDLDALLDGATAGADSRGGAGRGAGGAGSPPSAAGARLADASIPLARARFAEAADEDRAGGAGSEGRRPRAAASGVQAGEWDDNANYREFQKYLETERWHHPVDIRQRRFLVVRDAAGKPVPDCRVTVTDGKGRHTTLMTSTAGRALLFPRAEGLVGRRIEAIAECQGARVGATFSIDEDDGLVDLKLPRARVLPTTRSIDVAFVLDTTGSMSEEIAAVKTTLQRVTRGLDGERVRVRVGMVEYRDRGDQFVTRVRPMSTDAAGFARAIAGVQAGGGGDPPESVNEALHVALSQLEWDPEALGRFAFLVGDAPPHLDYAQDFDYAQEMRRAAHSGVQVFTVAASGMDALGQAVWRQIAQYTGGTNLFVLRGGLGPQSTGGGDPRSSCGGTQTRYTSGNLDVLLLATITRQLRALDGDPLRIAGLMKDESAKPCEERLAAH